MKKTKKTIVWGVVILSLVGSAIILFLQTEPHFGAYTASGWPAEDNMLYWTYVDPIPKGKVDYLSCTDMETRLASKAIYWNWPFHGAPPKALYPTYPHY